MSDRPKSDQVTGPVVSPEALLRVRTSVIERAKRTALEVAIEVAERYDSVQGAGAFARLPEVERDRAVALARLGGPYECAACGGPATEHEGEPAYLLDLGSDVLCASCALGATQEQLRSAVARRKAQAGSLEPEPRQQPECDRGVCFGMDCPVHGLAARMGFAPAEAKSGPYTVRETSPGHLTVLGPGVSGPGPRGVYDIVGGHPSSLAVLLARVFEAGRQQAKAEVREVLGVKS